MRLRRLMERGIAVAAIAFFALAHGLPPAEAMPPRTNKRAKEKAAAAPVDRPLELPSGPEGVGPDVAPRISDEERAELDRILPVIGGEAGPAGLERAATELAALTRPDGSALVDFTLGNVLFQLDRLDDAATAYGQACAKSPSWVRARKNLGIVLARLGRNAEAVDALSRVIQAGQGDALTHGLLGHAHSSMGSWVAAEAAFRMAVLLQSDIPDWKLGLAQAVLRQGKHADAASLAEELLGKDPERVELWLLQANAFIGMGQPAKAALNYELLERMGGSTASSLMNLGDIRVNEEAWDLAALAYTRAVALDASDVKGMLRRVLALSQRGAMAQARDVLEALRTATEGREMDDLLRQDLLRAQARLDVAAGEGGAALEVIDELIRIDPLDGEALLMLADHHAAHGDPERALFALERAVKVDGVRVEALVRQARVLVDEGRFAEAVPPLQKAQELSPRDDVARYLEQVQRIARSRG